MIKFHIIIIPFIFPSIISILFKVNGQKKQYCFYKYGVESEETLFFSFSVSSDKRQTIKAILKNRITNKIFYENDKASSGSTTVKEKSNGYRNYEICFYPNTEEKFYISFEIYSPNDDSGTKNLGTDKQMKEMNKGMKDISFAFKNIHANARQIVDRRFNHNKILKEIIKSIEYLTFTKVGIIALLSFLQIYTITRFFGDEKRVSSIKGAFSETL